VAADKITPTPTFRDTLAVQAPEMDVADICNLMGWEIDLPLSSDDVSGDEDDEDDEARDDGDSVIARWNQLPLKKRLAAMTQFRYRWADEMLRAREMDLSGDPVSAISSEPGPEHTPHPQQPGVGVIRLTAAQIVAHLETAEAAGTLSQKAEDLLELIRTALADFGIGRRKPDDAPEV